METERRLGRRLLDLALAGAAISCSQPVSQESSPDMANYAKFTVHVDKTATHDEYEVFNGIIIDFPKDSGRLSSLKFCDPDTELPIEVSITDTDYYEKNKAIADKELKAKETPAPFYTARAGEKPCELIVNNTVLLVRAHNLSKKGNK